MEDSSPLARFNALVDGIFLRPKSPVDAAIGELMPLAQQEWSQLGGVDPLQAPSNRIWSGYVWICALRNTYPSPGELGGREIMEAVTRCLEFRLGVPDWLASEFARRANAVGHGKAASWDAPEAFGNPMPKGMNAKRWAALCRDAKKGEELERRVRAFLCANPSAPWLAVVEEEGRKLALSEEKARELFDIYRENYVFSMAAGRHVPWPGVPISDPPPRVPSIEERFKSK